MGKKGNICQTLDNKKKEKKINKRKKNLKKNA